MRHGWPRILLTRCCRMPVGRLDLAPRGGPGAAASKAGQGSRSGHESGPYGLASGDARERKERAPGRSGPRVGEASSTRHARRARRTRAAAPPHRSHPPAGGRPECPQHGASKAEPSLGASPAGRPRTVVSARDEIHIILGKSHLRAFCDLKIGRLEERSVGVSPNVRQSSLSEARQLAWE